MGNLISVIIPCFNHGHFIDEALDSLRENLFSTQFEIIIVDDGSTDRATIEKLLYLEMQGFNIIRQKNLGLANARNTGIKTSNGKYILPLDSDNKINPSVFVQAAGVMESDHEIDVIYTDAEYFGFQTGKWKVGEYNGLRLLYGNYIDACALIRKETLIEIGMYDPCMPGMGNEDWELWVRFFLNDRKFYYLQQTGFYYRVLQNSMSVTTTRPNASANKGYIYRKHSERISNLFWGVTYEDLQIAKRIPQIRKRIDQNRIKEALKILFKRPLF